MTDQGTESGGTREWARRHQVAWEIETVSEAVKAHGIQQTGVELRLFGAPQLGHDGAFAELHEQMRELVQGLLPADQEIHVEVEAFEPKAHLRPETGYVPEVQLTVRLTPTNPEHKPTPEHVRDLLTRMERGLRDLGLHPRVWGSR